MRKITSCYKIYKRLEKKYPFINEVRNDQYSFYCTICKRNVKCGHMGLSDVQRHIATSIHERFAKDSRSQTTLSFPSSSSPVFEKVNFHMNYVLLLMTIAQLNRKVCTYTFSGYKNLSIACIVSDICYLLYRNSVIAIGNCIIVLCMAFCDT